MPGHGQNLDQYVSNFERFEKSLNGESKQPLHAVRKAALARFTELGFPTTRDEEWRFTNVAPIAKQIFVPALPSDGHRLGLKDIEPYLFKADAPLRMVFVNGHWAPALSAVESLPPGVRVMSLARAIVTEHDLVTQNLSKYVRFDGNAFAALNMAFLKDGAFVMVPDGVELSEAVHLLFLQTGGSSPVMATMRNVIVAGIASRVSIVESYVGIGAPTSFTNAVTEFIVGDRAIVEHDKLQVESTRSFHIGTTHFHQGGGSGVVSNAIALGGRIARNDVTAVLNAEGCTCTLNGLSVATGDQLIDNHTTIDHAKPGCESHELYASILDGKSRGVFNGKILVRKDAQKTDAKQTNRTLLLSDEATIDTKPQLEIFADDVKCTHGATVGQLDEDQVFYLRARGIDLVEARDVLTFAFARAVIDRIHVDPLREQLDAMLHTRLRQGRVASEV
jgi:Fe-S cluster assembly protein SufD